MPISLRNAGSLFAYLRYSPQENKMFVAGEDGKPREISFLNKNFAVDIETGTKGWLLIDTGMRDWKSFGINDDPPPSPGPNYKRGFSFLVYAPKLLGSAEPHEMCSSTAAHLSFCERLYNEAEPQFSKGNVPIVKITAAEAIKSGKGKSRDIQFEIVKWIPRPPAIIEALAKLKAAETTTDKKSTGTSGSTQTDAGGDDFDDDVKPEAEPKKTTTEQPKAEPKKTTTEKPKTREKKAQAEEPHSSDLLDDEIPFA